MIPQLKDMQGIQFALFIQLCQHCRSVMPIAFREFAERPWLDGWWSMVLKFMWKLLLLPESSLQLLWNK